MSKEDPLPALLVNPFAAPPISLPALQPTVETPQAFLQRELAHIERVLVDWSPRAEVVSWQAPPDILPGTMVTVRNEEAAAQVVVTFVCSAEVSRQLLNNAAREFARELARELGPSKRGRRVVVRVQSAGDRAPPLEAVSDSDEVSG